MVEGNQVQLQLGRVVSEGRNIVKGNRFQLRAGKVLSEGRNEGDEERRRQVGTEAAKKPVLADGWKFRSWRGMEQSSASAGTASEVGIDSSCERSLWRTDLIASLTYVHFRQNQNREWTGSLQVRRVRTGPRADSGSGLFWPSIWINRWTGSRAGFKRSA